MRASHRRRRWKDADSIPTADDSENVSDPLRPTAGINTSGRSGPTSSEQLRATDTKLPAVAEARRRALRWDIPPVVHIRRTRIQITYDEPLPSKKKESFSTLVLQVFSLLRSA